ncbi:19398_t:CDS:1, partial [Cetraspora pellucida]
VQLGANLRHGAVGQAGNIVIPAHTVFDEDWSFADGCQQIDYPIHQMLIQAIV